MKFTASEARSLASSCRNELSAVLLKAAEVKIKQAAGQGYSACNFPGNAIPQNHRRMFVQLLEELGYSVKHETGDQREPDDTYIISWAETAVKP